MDEEGPQRLRHLQHHKAQDRKLGEKQEKANPLISCFSRHLEVEQKNSNLVCTVKIVWTDTDKQKGTERQR